MKNNQLKCPNCGKKSNWNHNLQKLDKTEHYTCSFCKTKLYKKEGKKIGLMYFYDNE